MANIKEKLNQGHVHSRVIVEVVGKPKEHVEEAIKDYVEKLKKNPDFEVINHNISEASEIKDEKNPGLWGTFVEIEMITESLSNMVGFCFDYMPSSVEILSPQEMKIKYNQAAGMLNDMQGKLHQIDMFAKKINNENNFLKMNTQALMRNFISILLFNSRRSAAEIAGAMGMEKKDIEQFLDIMIKENRVIKEGERYHLVKK